MAEQPLIDEDIVNEISPFQKPIPGQSLTNDPDTSYAWESPPEYVTVEDGIEYFMDKLLDKDAFSNLIQLLASKRFSIATLAQIMLEKGWREGKWKSDLMLLLAEPLMVILMAISERAEIRDYELYDGENDEVDDEEEIAITKDLRDSMKEDTFFRGISIPPVRKESVPEGVLEQIKEMPVPKQESLLAAPEENTSEESLLGRS